MSSAPELQNRQLGTVQFALKVQDAKLEVKSELPEGPVHPAVLLPILRNLSNSMSELGVRGAEKLGNQLSCREGCGACCRQAVPITPIEARMLAEWIDEQPHAQQAVLRERFRQGAARLQESGIAQRVRDAAGSAGRDAVIQLGLDYFALGIPCPFLEEERCTIHPMRPLRCREYLVASPAEHCDHPETKQVVGINPPVKLSQILAKWDTNGDPQPHELILLTMLDEWVERHPAEIDRPHRTAPELLQEFLHAFATDATAPADPLGAPGSPLTSGL